MYLSSLHLLFFITTLARVMSTAARYARVGFRELLPEHECAVEAAELLVGGARLRELTDRSLGAAVFAGRGGSRVVLLIEQISQGARFWSLPKGHAEPGDADDAATAIREIREETGIALHPSQLVPGVWCGSAYSYCGTPHVSQATSGAAANEKVVFHKSTIYGLADLGANAAAKGRLPELALQASEVANAEFLSVDVAVSRLRHNNDRKVLQELAERHAQLA